MFVIRAILHDLFKDMISSEFVVTYSEIPLPKFRVAKTVMERGPIVTSSVFITCALLQKRKSYPLTEFCFNVLNN